MRHQHCGVSERPSGWGWRDEAPSTDGAVSFQCPGSRQMPAADQEDRRDASQPRDLRASGAAECPRPAAPRSPCQRWTVGRRPGLVPLPRQRCQGTETGQGAVTTLLFGLAGDAQDPRHMLSSPPPREQHEAGAAEQEGSTQSHRTAAEPVHGAGPRAPSQHRVGAARHRRPAPAGLATHREY